MISFVNPTSNRKTGPIAVTYRAGKNKYGTCPSDCPLNPQAGTNVIDKDYLAALTTAVPKGGLAWTYTHFPIDNKWAPGQTVINRSYDDVDEAAKSPNPSVVVLGKDSPYYHGKHFVHGGRRFVRCPAEYLDLSCHTCGSGKPLCARGDRDYHIAFNAHGTGAAKVGKSKGGCYASTGPVSWQWAKVTKVTATSPDGQSLREWVSALPTGTFLRHHIAGDIGLET